MVRLFLGLDLAPASGCSFSCGTCSRGAGSASTFDLQACAPLATVYDAFGVAGDAFGSLQNVQTPGPPPPGTPGGRGKVERRSEGGGRTLLLAPRYRGDSS